MSETDPLISDEAGEQPKLEVPAYGEKRLSEQRRLSEGPDAAGGPPLMDPDEWFLITITICTYITSFIAIGYAVRSQMAEVTVEALSESVDAISYSMNLWCAIYTRGMTMKMKDKYEFRVACVTTLLLFAAVGRICYQSVKNIRCSNDVDFDPHNPGDRPCAFSQQTPDPELVMKLALIFLLFYIPPILVFVFVGKGLSGFRPDENINKASVLLHMFFDMSVQVVFIIAAVWMMEEKSDAVRIDARVSLFLAVLLLAGSVWMWWKYAKASHVFEDEPQPEGASS